MWGGINIYSPAWGELYGRGTIDPRIQCPGAEWWGQLILGYNVQGGDNISWHRMSGGQCVLG